MITGTLLLGLFTIDHDIPYVTLPHELKNKSSYTISESLYLHNSRPKNLKKKKKELEK